MKRRGGWKLSAEARENIRQGHIGINTWMTGRKLSSSVREKMRLSQLRRVAAGLHNTYSGKSPLKSKVRERTGTHLSVPGDCWRIINVMRTRPIRSSNALRVLSKHGIIGNF